MNIQHVSYPGVASFSFATLDVSVQHVLLVYIVNPKHVLLQHSVRGMAAGSFLLWQRDSICYGSKIMQAKEACFSILSHHGCTNVQYKLLWQLLNVCCGSMVL